ncbi:MAG: cytochrome ubiquinol oxidase subunit I [Myxococcota bacterium]
MDDLLIARSQMALSLGFHIVFAAVGIGMPLLMVIAEVLGWRTGDRTYDVLAKRWSKGVAILFAVGAVSGTVLSFELGLLWPSFMEFAGPIIGMPFSLEGFAFFLEAIFLGVYLYGWDRVPKWAHVASGVMVTVCGTLSGVFVTATNAWMNSPQPWGYTLDEAGNVATVDPLVAMFNPMFPSQALHMTIAAFLALGIAVAAVHAHGLLNDPESQFHRKAFGIAIVVAAVTGLIMPATGHLAGEAVGHYQPVKLAAMEAHWETTEGAAFLIGGIPDEQAEETHYGIEIPYLLSLLATGDPNGEVLGLSDVPEENRPPVAIVHFSFQIMIAIGSWLAALGVFVLGYAAWKRRIPRMRALLWAVVVSGPMGMIAIETGWIVTEVGRQPWIIHELVRTADAVTPMPGLMVPFLSFMALYLFLGVMCVVLLRRLVLASPSNEELRQMGALPSRGDDGA